jgi:F-type H+-transporting ATPase subunit b
MRFKGIPLEGEAHAPLAAFRDCDKVYYGPPIPAVPKDYKEHPERDLENFPYPQRIQYAPKTRMLMIPDSWCRPIEKVTGTSGPYLLIGGLAAFLVNKEIWVIDEAGMMLFGWVFWYLVLSRAVAYRLDKSIAENALANKVKFLKSLVQDDLKEAVEFRKTSAAESESLKAAHETFPTIFKENLALQLEATYRRNVDAVATELKRRLDYLQEVEATKERFERDIYIKSIIEGVQKMIAENEGSIRDRYLENCIEQLKVLSVGRA